jgi:hypothetical protein
MKWSRCMMKHVLFIPAILVVLILMRSTDAAQTPKAPALLYKNNIGAAAGFITGYGISYRRLLDENSILQITGFPFYYESKYDNSSIDSYSSIRDSGYSNFGNVSVGLTWLRVIVRELDLRLLAYTGVNLNTRYEKSAYRERSTEWDSGLGDYDTLITHVQKEETINRITIGGGMGGEFQVWRLTGSLMVGIQAYYERETKNKGIIPSAEIGGYFGF